MARRTESNEASSQTIKPCCSLYYSSVFDISVLFIVVMTALLLLASCRTFHDWTYVGRPCLLSRGLLTFLPFAEHVNICFVAKSICSSQTMNIYPTTTTMLGGSGSLSGKCNQTSAYWPLAFDDIAALHLTSPSGSISCNGTASATRKKCGRVEPTTSSS